MTILNSYTNDIVSKIASLKAIDENIKNRLSFLRSLNLNNLFESLIEILSQLGGYEDMIQAIDELLTSKIVNIEEAVKSSIKISIKKIIACGVEPTINSDLINDGVYLDLKKIDPMSIFKIDPTSDEGKYAYFDNNSGISSKDFNVFLYTVIENSIDNPLYTGDTWSGGGLPLFNVKFIENDEVNSKTNQLHIKVDGLFSGYTISYLISEYLDSITLFNSVQLFSNIFDDILNTSIVSVNKTNTEMEIEAMISKIVDDIMDNINDENEIIDDSFYTFSNDVYNEIATNIELKQKKIYKGMSGEEIEFNEDIVKESLDALNDESTLIVNKTNMLSDMINRITEDASSTRKIDKSDSYELKVNIVKGIIKRVATAISIQIFSPKVLILISMTNKLYGIEDQGGAVEFLKENINIYKLIITDIRDMISDFIIEKITEKATPLITRVSAELIKEKFAIYKKQIDTIKGFVS